MLETGQHERRLRRRVAATWALLLFNVMPYDKTLSIVPIPNSVGKLIGQAALPLALLLALSVNRKLQFRPNVFLCLVSLMALEAVMTAFAAQYPKGTAFRTFRVLDFVAVLWLLTPYWGRGRDGLLLLRYYLNSLFFVVCTVVVGFCISPGKALDNGRLSDIIWPSPSTQVAHYAAVAMGITVILWFAGLMRGKRAVTIVLISFAVLILTHTRTALLAGVVGIVVGGLSLMPTTRRVRKTFAIAVGAALLIYVAAASAITSWLARGEGTKQLSNLTGRTDFWGPLLAFPRDRFEMIFGFGLSNGSFRGLPIDSNWLDAYQDQGLFGATICGLILLFLLVAAFVQVRGVNRALVLFFTVYGLVASFTEDGITNPSPYLLDVAAAASLLVVPVVAQRRSRRAGLAVPAPSAPAPREALSPAAGPAGLVVPDDEVPSQRAGEISAGR
ncbi:MAG TPA: hypothetical protein VGD91_20810 [Trebonia sp.]